LKRSLRVVGDCEDLPVQAPQTVTIGERLVSIADTGDGRSGLQFADLLIGGGATRVDSASDAKVDTRVVIRGTPKAPAARLRAEAVEEAADVVLGSSRPAFARLFASACARWVNS
jgi:hypothetical protein